MGFGKDGAHTHTHTRTNARQMGETSKSTSRQSQQPNATAPPTTTMIEPMVIKGAKTSRVFEHVVHVFVNDAKYHSS